MADEQEFAAVGTDEVVPELLVKEGEDIDYRIVLAFYLLADLGECGHMSPSGEGVGALRSLVMLPPNTAPVCTIVFVACFILAREEGYWVVTIPFLPLTLWMLMKVRTQQARRALVAADTKAEKSK